MARIENPSREHILGRIRQALAKPAPPIDMTPVPMEEIFAPVTDVRERFLAECKINLTEVIPTSSVGESAERLAALLAQLAGEGEIFLQDAPALRELAKSLNGRTLRWSSEDATDHVAAQKEKASASNKPLPINGSPVSESCQATITLAEAFVAQTGSVLTSSHCGGRGASAVPPTHIVYGEVSQIVPDVTAAMRLAKEKCLTLENSYVGLISGSSRTADIEKILVQGAHGPRRLVVILQG